VGKNISSSATKSGKRTREYLTAEELDKLLAASKGCTRNPERDYCILLLMFRHGLRVSELCAIKLSDINVETKEFHVNRLKGCDSGPHELFNGESPAIKSLDARASEDGPARRLRHSVYQRTAQTAIAGHRVGHDRTGCQDCRSGAFGYPPSHAPA
jgi:hypothetical protein